MTNKDNTLYMSDTLALTATNYQISSSQQTLSSLSTSLKITQKLLAVRDITEADWHWWTSLTENWQAFFFNNVLKLPDVSFNWQVKSNVIEHLMRLFTLDSLIVKNSSFNSLKPLRHLKQVQNIELLVTEDTKLNDLKDLSNLNCLKLSNKQPLPYEFYEVLGKFEHLQALDIADNHLINVDFTVSLIQLKTLNISWNNVKELSGLVKLPELNSLLIDATQLGIAIYNVLPQLTALTVFSLSQKPTSSADLLQTDTQAKADFEQANIKDISFLQFAEKLEQLEMCFNNIEDISVLAQLTSLKQLNLSFNKIENLNSLAQLKNLEILDLSGNEVVDISVLVSLTQLKQLNLDYNPIKPDYIDWLQKQLPNCDISCISHSALL